MRFQSANVVFKFLLRSDVDEVVDEDEVFPEFFTICESKR